MKNRYSFGGDEHIFVEVDEAMSLEAFFTSLSITNAVKEAKIKGVSEICPANASFQIKFDPDVISPDDMLKEREKELIDAAAGMAAHRLKTNFILHRIAERENIQVTKEDLDLRIRQEATRYDISPDKMRKELQQRNALDEVAEQLLLGKTLDFLKADVSIELTKEPAVQEENS